MEAKAVQSKGGKAKQALEPAREEATREKTEAPKEQRKGTLNNQRITSNYSVFEHK